MILGLLYYFTYSESFFWVLLDRSVVTWSDAGGGPGGVLTTDRRRPCHRWGDSETRPPSAPHWPALATSRWAAHAWTKTAPSEGKGGGGTGRLRIEPKYRKGGRRPRRRAMGAAPKLMAHGQIMEVTNKEKKTREYFFLKRKQQRDKTRTTLMYKKPVMTDKRMT